LGERVAAAVDVGIGVDDVVVGGHGPWDMHTTDVLGTPNMIRRDQYRKYTN